MSLHAAHVNVRSLLANLGPFQHHVLRNGYDVIGVTETWLHSGVDNDLVSIADYNFFGQNRCNRRGGGVGLYVKNNIRCEVVLSASLQYIEHLWVKLTFNGEFIILGNIYRPPNSDINQFFNFLEDTLSNLYSEYDKMICFGDFNINMLNLNTNVASQLEAIFSTFNMEQRVKEPTRISPNSISLLDLIFTNIDEVTDVGVLDSSTADHFLVHFKLNLNMQVVEPETFFYRSLKKIKFDKFQRDLEQLPLDNIFYIQNIDDKLSFFNNCILGLFDKHAPLKQFRKDNNYKYAPWITENIKLLQKLRNKALKRYKQTKSPAHYEYYKQLRNYTTSAIRAEQKAYLRFKFQNCSMKEKWSELKNLSISKNKQKTLPDHLGNVNDINDFFINSAINNMLPGQGLLNFYNNNTLHNVNDSFNFVLSTENEIFNIIKNIKTRATGNDKINITFILLCCPYIVPYITHIINECILTSYFPTLWKQAQVIPLPKINNPTEFSHLRSISILPTLSKVLERIMNGQIVHFLNLNNILPVKQSGFRTGYSCESALSDITDDILKATDQNKISALVLLDFSKAFDMLNHEVLLAILHYVGFSNVAEQFINSFLSNRTQQVICNQKYSSFLDVRVGVPQGSILGPLLYTIYTSKFLDALQHCNYHFYADDSQIYYSFHEDELNAAEIAIMSDLTNFYNLATDHLLKLNPSKSSVILFGNESQINFVKNNMTIKLNNVPLPYCDSCKSLGLTIDSRLRFKAHVTAKLRSAYGNLKLIYGNRHSLPRETRKLLCDALVLSQFNHCSGVYVPCLDAADRHRIQKVQNACLRLIYGINRRNHISPYLSTSGWLSMYNRFKLHFTTSAFKLIKFKTPAYLYQKIRFRTDVHNLNLRRRCYLTVPQHRKEIYKRSFSYGVATCINAVRALNTNQSVLSFKNSIKNHLFSLQ